VVAGHSAGGQFASRYAMASQVHDRLPVKISYLVANPSSYTYLDGLRPTWTELPAGVAAAAPGYVLRPPANPPAAFAPYPDAKNCTGYDTWPYGLRERVGYSAALGDDQLKQQLVARPAVYLLGELDTLPLYGFDSSCSAMAQGPTRVARGLAYAKYVSEKFGAQHKTLVVPACGHNGRCVFTADPVLPLLFPKE
jgi:pimeloyl-ACP methyl ester carboxylesterase